MHARSPADGIHSCCSNSLQPANPMPCTQRQGLCFSCVHTKQQLIHHASGGDALCLIGPGTNTPDGKRLSRNKRLVPVRRNLRHSACVAATAPGLAKVPEQVGNKAPGEVPGFVFCIATLLQGHRHRVLARKISGRHPYGRPALQVGLTRAVQVP